MIFVRAAPTLWEQRRSDFRSRSCSRSDPGTTRHRPKRFFFPFFQSSNVCLSRDRSSGGSRLSTNNAISIRHGAWRAREDVDLRAVIDYRPTRFRRRVLEADRPDDDGCSARRWFMTGCAAADSPSPAIKHIRFSDESGFSDRCVIDREQSCLVYSRPSYDFRFYFHFSVNGVVYTEIFLKFFQRNLTGKNCMTFLRSFVVPILTKIIDCIMFLFRDYVWIFEKLRKGFWPVSYIRGSHLGNITTSLIDLLMKILEKDFKG